MMLDKIKNFFLFIQKFNSIFLNKGIKSLKNLNGAKTVFNCLQTNEKIKEVMFVGGCVRKALNKEKIDDVDIATIFKPSEVKEKLLKNKIKVIDTGISHGTVTAIVEDKKFEITTLREDLSTDGRHANVVFVSNWDKDAMRRDFTINSIYSSIDGEIFDPLNGVSDLKNGKIKFIGNAEERIKEDYLRILRYFRFFIQYSKFDHEQKTINSIKKNVNGLNNVSNERKIDELKKILLLKNFGKLFLDENTKYLILNIFPQLKHYQRLSRLEKLGKNLENELDEILLLAILIVDNSDNYEYFSHKYKLSKKIRNRFSNIANNLNFLEKNYFLNNYEIKKQLYLSSLENVKDLLLFSFFYNEKYQAQDIKNALSYLNKCEKPKFPISGDTLKSYGYESGEKLGQVLKKIEEKWILNNFSLEEEAIRKILNKKN